MLVFLIIMLIVVLVLLFIIASAALGLLLTWVPFVPSNAAEIEFVVKKIGLSEKDVFYDLGSGNGKVVFLVEKLSGAQATGFELTWWTHLLAKFKKLATRSKSEFKNKNFFKASWSEASCIYAYLYPPLMGRVEEKFLADCRPGSFAVVRDFPFPSLAPQEAIKMPNKHTIFIYRKV